MFPWKGEIKFIWHIEKGIQFYVSYILIVINPACQLFIIYIHNILANHDKSSIHIVVRVILAFICSP